MKHLSRFLILTASLFLLATSCKKHDMEPGHGRPTRTVQFSLYSDKDLSNDNDIITLRASIQNDANQTLWDSILAPIKIKDIPDVTRKLTFQKTVPNNNPSVLKVGFYYSIENVGNSWHLERFEAGETFKVVDFNFQ